MRMSRDVWAASLCLALVACVPDLDSDESTITGPRVIAVQAEPAEAAAGDPVSYRALVVDHDGQSSEADISWYYCTVPKPLAELGPINQDCLRGSSGALTRLGDGAEVAAELPRDACSLFGPDPPAPIGDEPPGRPADPDQTGGYKLPVMLGLPAPGGGEDVSLFEQRLSCGLAGVNIQTSREFAQRYRDNVNPHITRISVQIGGVNATPGEDGVVEVGAGEELRLKTRWPACPESDVCGDGVCGPDETEADCADDCDIAPVGCDGQERYLWFDDQRRELVVRRESMRVGWYATAGTYQEERTGVGEDEVAQASSNRWTAPNAPGDVTLWSVLRDSRGGVGFRELRLRVR